MQQPAEITYAAVTRAIRQACAARECLIPSLVPSDSSQIADDTDQIPLGVPDVKLRGPMRARPSGNPRLVAAADFALLLRDLSPLELKAVVHRYWGIRHQRTVEVIDKNTGAKYDIERAYWPSEREVARRLGLTEGHTRELIRSARRKVRDRLAERAQEAA